jgi:hypothetical protein
MTATMTRTDLTAALNQRIAELGLEDTDTNCYGLVCYDETGIDGTAFRIDGDGSGAVLIDGPATLAAMEEVDYTGDFEADQQAFYDALVKWEANND